MSEDQIPGDFILIYPNRSVSLRALVGKKKKEGEYSPTRQAISDLKYDRLRYEIQLK